MGIVNIQVDPQEAAKAAAGGGRAMDEGPYVLKVQGATQESAKKQGSYPNIVCKCEVLQSPNGKHLGQTVTRRFNLSPRSVPYNLIPFLKAAGIHYQDNGQGVIAFDTDHLRGATTKVTLSVQKGTTRPLENWDNDEPYGAPQAPQAYQPAPQQVSPQGWAPPQAGGFPPQQQGFPQQGYAPPQQGYPQPMQPMQQQPMQSVPPQPQHGPAGAPPPWMAGRGNGMQGG